MLLEQTLFGVRDKVQIAIDRLRQFEPPEGYYLAFSGGKDSCVIKDLAIRAGVKFDAHYNLTTVDPPELIYFIREYHADVHVNHPKKTMWELIAKKSIPPTRIARYCCGELKERGGKGRLVITGVRWAESARRSKRQMVEQCYNDNSKRYIHPIIDWCEDDVWDYIRMANMPYCKLYDEGQRRIGCVLCPMQGPDGMRADEARWPRIADAYKRACQKAYEYCKKRGKKMTWKSGEDMYNWWISGKAAEKENPDQTVIFE